MSEIALLFELRHPQVVGLYAWFRLPGAMPRVGMLIEFASRGDLQGFYKGPGYSLIDAVQILCDAAKGMEYLHR